MAAPADIRVHGFPRATCQLTLFCFDRTELTLESQVPVLTMSKDEAGLLAAPADIRVHGFPRATCQLLK